MQTAASRFDTLDTLRGLAVVWMTLFHFCFDLNQFGYWTQNFYTDPFWTWQRSAIVSLFLFCAGLSQAVALAQGQTAQRFWRRWAQVAGCAVLVTAGSYVMYPQSFIYFGVLHGIALMLLVVRYTAGWGRGLWWAGAAAIAMPLIAVQAFKTPALADVANLANLAEIFNSKALNWLGLITRKPITEDYVPLLPWLGVVWWGVATGQWVLAQYPDGLKASVRGTAPLAWMGRWSLSWYMLHQPVIIGVLMGLAAFKKF